MSLQGEMLLTMFLFSCNTQSFLEWLDHLKLDHSYGHLDGVLKSRVITLLTKVHIVKTMVLPALMYGCDSWTIKKAERQKIDAFEPWCWKRCLRVPWTAGRSNQSIIKEISPEYSLEGLMLKLQYFATWCEELTHWKRPCCWERLKAGGEGDYREWDDLMASLTGWTWVWAWSGSWWWTWKRGMLQFMGSQRVRHDWAIELKWNMKRQKKKVVTGSGKSLSFRRGWSVEAVDFIYGIQSLPASSQSEKVLENNLSLI